MIKTFSMSISVRKNKYPPIFLYLCCDRKLTQWPYDIIPVLNIPHRDSSHTRHIYPQTQSNFWLFPDKPGLLDGDSVERISLSWCQTDLFFLPALQLGQRSAQPRPSTPPPALSPIYQVHQCFMSPGGHWLAARSSSSSSSFYFPPNMSEQWRPGDVRQLFGFLSSGCVFLS